MEDNQFEQKVLSGVETLAKGQTETKNKVEQVLADVSRMDTETKKVLEDITLLKKSANDSQSGMETMQRKIEEFDQRVRLQARSDFGNPIARIQADEEMRTKLNCLVRSVCARGNDSVTKAANVLQRALGENTSPGSTVIDDKLAAELYDTLSTFGVWNTFAVRNLGTKQTKYPVKTARPVANFVLTEAGTVADDTTKAGTSVTLQAEVIAVLLNVSLQLLEDAEIDVTADVLNDFAQAYANRLDFAALRADGTADATNGGMTGVFNFGTAATADAGAGADDTVEELEFEDITRCLLTVDPIVLQRPAKWWMHPQILVRMLSIKDSNGRPIFLTALEAPTPNALGSILGYPVIPSLVCPTTNSANQKVAVFGDPDAMVVGVRRDYAFEASDEFRWNTLERSFRGWGRAGVKGRRALGFSVLTLGA